MRKYRSTRGRASHSRDRRTLHKKHLDAFRSWFVGTALNWEICPATPHTYEVFHVKQVSRAGDGEHQFIYRNDKNDHLTVQHLLVPYVNRWLKERKAK